MEKRYDYKVLYSLYRDGYRKDKKQELRKNLQYNTYQKELISDRSRILYCAAFRRLQQKAQVFSLETNSNVRSRLTHSLEVADLGRRLANGITQSLRERTENGQTVPGFKAEEFPLVAAIVENACLLHDIGNPPFGHFGEAAIQDWAKHQAMNVLPDGMKYDGLLSTLMQDFREFDGNPQGFRTVTRLCGSGGLNLTCATLLCGLKYARTTGEESDDGIKKKAGYFRTEEKLVARLLDQAGRNPGTRYPMTYIMEAADDISYCMSDIADGIEKRILTEEQFIMTFDRIWREEYGTTPPKEITRFYRDGKWTSRELRDFNRDFAIDWSTRATDDAVEAYVSHHDAIYRGTAAPLMARGTEMCRVLETINEVCVEILYPSIQAESIELTGYAVITGILRHYERILKLDYETYEWLADPAEAKRKYNEKKDAGEKMSKPRLDVERRLHNRFDAGCLAAYRGAVQALRRNADPDFEVKEWWLRVHLLIDHISSMTDAFALETYQMLEGIALMKT